MDELIKQVSQKTGLSEDMARQATTTVIGYLKTKLPAPIAGQIDNVLGGAGGAAMPTNLGDITKDIGGMFGNK